MKKSCCFFWGGVCSLVLVFNVLMPMTIGGDDYVYAFVWNFRNELVPIPENAQRIASWGDLLTSQWNHYFTWGGRTVAHILAQFFIWQGKPLFNVCNTLVTLLVFMEIAWLAARGQVSLAVSPRRASWIIFALWAFVPGFSAIFWWLTGACNYLWTMAILLGFLLPYVGFLFRGQRDGFVFRHPVLLCFWGLLAGWTNENNVAIVFWFCLYTAFRQYREGGGRQLLWGAGGMLAGYGLLMLAPGNSARLAAELAGGMSGDWQVWLKNTQFVFSSILFYQLFMWYFFFRVMLGKKRFGESPSVLKIMGLARVFGAMSLLVNAVMLLSPEYPHRAAFGSGVFLLIAVTALWDLQAETGQEVMKRGARVFLQCLGAVFLLVTMTASLYGLSLEKKYESYVIDVIEEAKSAGRAGEILEVMPYEQPEWLDAASAYHMPIVPLNELERGWVNVALTRYYGVKGIRTIENGSSED